MKLLLDTNVMIPVEPTSHEHVEGQTPWLVNFSVYAKKMAAQNSSTTILVLISAKARISTATCVSFRSSDRRVGDPSIQVDRELNLSREISNSFTAMGLVFLTANEGH